MPNTLSYQPIPRHDTLSRQAFIRDFLQPGKPVIFRSFAQDWPATQKWHYDYLKQGCGEVEVPLYSEAFATSDNDYMEAAETMKFGDYLDLIAKGPTPLRMFLFDVFKHMPQLCKDFAYPDLGVRFLKRFPFLFVGGQNAYVDIHYDLDHGHVFLTQLQGKKRVILYDRKDARALCRHPFTVSCNIDFRDPDLKTYPQLKDLTGFECHLQHGDTLFIPSRWWHYVEYTTDGLSLSLRAMPNSWWARLTGLVSIFKLKVIDARMGKWLGAQKWYDIKEKWAQARIR